MSVQLVFKDNVSFTFPSADHLAPYVGDDRLTAVMATSIVIGAFVTNNLEYAILS
jgi:hypothetical protein